MTLLPQIIPAIFEFKQILYRHSHRRMRLKWFHSRKMVIIVFYLTGQINKLVLGQYKESEIIVFVDINKNIRTTYFLVKRQPVIPISR